MLLTNADITNEFLVVMNVSTTAGFYTDAMLSQWISKAQSWAGGYKKWPFTEGAVSTTFATSLTDEAGNYIMQYPEGWRADSTKQLTIGGKIFDKKNFYEFNRFREDNPNDASRIYTDYALKYYINPRSDSLSGTMTSWGQYQPAGFDWTLAPANTIFSGVADEGNEAILHEVISYALTREKSATSFYKGHFVSAASQHHEIAKGILEELWTKIVEEQANYQTLAGEGMWKRFDVTRGGFKEDLFRRDQWGL